MAATTTLFLCGDVMTGRGVDQVLPRSSAPRLYEPFVQSALEYVALAEQVNGPIPRPVDNAYVWGDALAVLEHERPDARIINLETSITTSEDADPKEINYRMHPDNVGVLLAAEVDCCTLANNHVLDWGVAGLTETLDVLASAGIRVAGAGRSAADAESPAELDVGDRRRVLVFAFGATDSGIPRDWRARAGAPGVNVIHDFSAGTVARVAQFVEASARNDDLVVASVHWGANWGYEIPDEHRRFAHDLIDDARVDVVWGHSSHHPKAIEVHRDRPIFYGCGDLLNDYEGIPGHEGVRGDLALMYFPSFEAGSGRMVRLVMWPMQIRNFRLWHASAGDREWLRRLLDRECGWFGHRVMVRDESIELAWQS